MKRLPVFLLTATIILVSCSAFASQKNVLVIHSYHPSLAWVRQYTLGITEVFADTAALAHVYLDSQRASGPEMANHVEKAMAIFRDLKPDVVMTCDDDALRLLGPRILDTSTPLVFLGVNNNPRSYFNTIPGGMSGVLERVLLFPWIRHLRKIIPNATTALVLMDDSKTAESILAVTFADRKQVMVDGIRVEYRQAGDWDQWQRFVLESKSHDFIAMPVYHSLKDKAGRHVPVEKLIRWTSANSPIPMFAYQDYAVGDDGVVGAYVIQGEMHGRRAALLAKDILEGRGAQSTYFITDTEGVFFFNKKRLKEFGLTLPDSIQSRTRFK